jgi:hypothetical protein
MYSTLEPNLHEYLISKYRILVWKANKYNGGILLFLDHSFLLKIVLTCQKLAFSPALGRALGFEFVWIDGASCVGIEIEVPRFRISVLNLEELNG